MPRVSKSKFYLPTSSYFRKQLVSCLYSCLNNSVFRSRNYRLVVDRANLMFLKPISAREGNFECKYASFKKIKFQRGMQLPDHALSLLFKRQFSSVRQFENHIELF